jgi:hypothetical protein
MILRHISCSSFPSAWMRLYYTVLVEEHFCSVCTRYLGHLGGVLRCAQMGFIAFAMLVSIFLARFFPYVYRYVYAPHTPLSPSSAHLFLPVYHDVLAASLPCCVSYYHVSCHTGLTAHIPASLALRLLASFRSLSLSLSLSGVTLNSLCVAPVPHAHAFV